MVAAEVTDSTFKQEVLESTVPVLVDFLGPLVWPLRMVAPVVEEIAEQYNGQIKVVKVNTDENPSVAKPVWHSQYSNVDDFLKMVSASIWVVGAVPKTTLANTLEKYL